MLQLRAPEHFVISSLTENLGFQFTSEQKNIKTTSIDSRHFRGAEILQKLQFFVKAESYEAKFW